jgi:hypothetical protein
VRTGCIRAEQRADQTFYFDRTPVSPCLLHRQMLPKLVLQ